MSGVTVEKEEK